ncbi:MAG: DUF1566 domain-containing protein [Chitinophagales bacterium]|nr:DUF1566 domain-containing protein [Chitinophagales bacterium]
MKTIIKKQKILLILLFATFLFSCKKDKNEPEPVITSPSVSLGLISNITSTGAYITAEVTNDGGAAISERGFCYNTVANPTIENNRVAAGSGKGTFTSNLTGLQKNTIYYLRAYAKNDKGIAYSTEISFTTETSLAKVVMNEILTGADFLKPHSVTAYATVQENGGSVVTERGICYGTSPNPTVANDKYDGGSGNGLFGNIIGKLTYGTTYYFRAYAVNSQGTAYSNQVQITTPYYAIGEEGPAGGRIFYDKGTFSDGWRYLECNNEDLNGPEGIAQYGSLLGPFPTTYSQIGYGQLNTTNLINYTIIRTNSTDYACFKAADYELNGYTDWYLPTINELKELYKIKNAAQIGNFFFWSSTNRMAFSFIDGTQKERDASNKYSVRAVRQL